MIAELARKKHSNIVQLNRYNGHIFKVPDINALFKAYRCPSCAEFIKNAYDLERHLITTKKIVKHVRPKKVYQLRETLFDNLDPFNIPYFDEQKLFKNKELFDF